MNRFLSFIALVLASIFAETVQADHICTNSPGEVFVGYSQGGNGVAPMPICRTSGEQGEGARAPVRVVKQWEAFDDRFGIFAIASNGPYGVSFDQSSAEAAESAALLQCQERGGVDCELMGAHMNSCSTFAWGGGKSAVSSESTPERSEQRALNYCMRISGEQCRVIETVCSRPISRWVNERPKDFVPKED